MTDLEALTQEIEKLEKRVQRDLAGRARANRITVIGGAILFVGILIYFAWIHSLVTDVARPESV